MEFTQKRNTISTEALVLAESTITSALQGAVTTFRGNEIVAHSGDSYELKIDGESTKATDVKEVNFANDYAKLVLKTKKLKLVEGGQLEVLVKDAPNSTAGQSIVELAQIKAELLKALIVVDNTLDLLFLDTKENSPIGICAAHCGIPVGLSKATGMTSVNISEDRYRELSKIGYYKIIDNFNKGASKLAFGKELMQPLLASGPSGIDYTRSSEVSKALIGLTVTEHVLNAYKKFEAKQYTTLAEVIANPEKNGINTDTTVASTGTIRVTAGISDYKLTEGETIRPVGNLVAANTGTTELMNTFFKDKDFNRN